MTIEEAFRTLEGFLPPTQARIVRQNLRGEEKEFFKEKLFELAGIVAAMPSTGQTDGQGDKAIAHLHYFAGGRASFYITEKDKGCEDDHDPTSVMYEERGKQHQAFGLADPRGDGGEIGYISIEEIIANRGELDFYFRPRTLAQVRSGKEPTNEPPQEISDKDLLEMLRAGTTV